MKKHHDWVLEKYLGSGAFGEVWLGQSSEQSLLKYAFKFFVNDRAGQWLERERDNLARVQTTLHDEAHIVHLIDIASTDKPFPYLVLEYVSGGSLEDWILEEKEFRADLVKFDVIEGITQAVAKAHEAKTYHRDLKPGNILLTEEGIPKIADFGLADIRTVDTSSLRRSVYSSHGAAQVGTPMYWPPEAWLPFSPRDPAQDDVFAIGVIWYQLLVERLERPPYDFASVLRIAGQDAHTINVISRCLAGPRNRFKNAIELADAIIDIDQPPLWNPIPPGLFDVQYLAREYIMQGV